MSDDAVTDSEARRLLGAAAATIEVDDPAPLTLTGLPEPRPHRRWSVLVAVAASVVLLASAAWVVARQLEDGKQVPPEPLERRETGVPALVGATVDEARVALAAAGYRAVVEEVPSCADPTGLVRSTEPAARQPLAEGGRVRLSVTADPGGDCTGPVTTGAVWDLIREAQGLPGPATCAGSNCEEALPTLADLAASEDRLQVAEGYGIEDLRCLRLSGQPATGVRRIYVHAAWVADDRVGLCPRPPVVQVDLDGAGGIVRVELRAERGALEDLTRLPEVTQARREAADRFVAWARTGEKAPPFASRVRRLTGGFGPPWIDEPADRSVWAGCSGLGFPDCGIDPVAQVYRSRGDVEVVTGIPPCPGAGNLAGRWADEADVVRVSDPGFACDDWYVLLWIDDSGAIYGVM